MVLSSNMVKKTSDNPLGNGYKQFNQRPNIGNLKVKQHGCIILYLELLHMVHMCLIINNGCTAYGS